MAIMYSLSNNQVWFVTNPDVRYRKMIKAPVELNGDFSVAESILLARQLFLEIGLDRPNYDTVAWNPVSELISPGAKVVLKPNWVLNEYPEGELDCLITHTDVVEAVLHYVVKAGPRQVTIGDAPICRCNFSRIIKNAELDRLVSTFGSLGYPISIEDYRLTKSDQRFENKRRIETDPEKHILFTLDGRSCLSPITTDNPAFLFTNHDLDMFSTHHYPGSQNYLIARKFIDADVGINLPKEKTHKKAGATGAFKNMVGINAFKEYLPHHWKGGSAAGGDCCQGSSWLRILAENELDRANRSEKAFFRRGLYFLAGLAQQLSQDKNMDGSWFGNDTAWGMVLDIQRILHYGESNGTLA